MVDRVAGRAGREATGPAIAGVLSQLLNTATSFITVFAASAWLTPVGFGRFAAAFAVVAILLAGARGLLGAAVMTHLPRLDAATSRTLAGGALAFAAVVGVAAAAIALVAGLLLPALLLFAPWLVAAVVHDVCRCIALARRDTVHALRLDVVWGVVGVVVAGGWWVVRGTPSIEVIAAAWGLGAVAGVLVHLVVARPPLVSARSFLSHTRTTVGWFAAISVIAQVEAYATVLLSAALLDPTETGGLRAVQLLALQPVIALLGSVLVVTTPRAIHRVHDRPDSPLADVVGESVRWCLGCAGLALAVWALHVPLMRLLLPQYVGFGDLVLPVALQAVAVAAFTPVFVALRCALDVRTETALTVGRAALAVASAWVALQVGDLRDAVWTTTIVSVAAGVVGWAVVRRRAAASRAA